MSNKFRIVLFFVIIASKCVAQSSVIIDSLTILLNKTKEDTTKAKIYNQIAYEYSASDFENTKKYSTEAISIGRQNKKNAIIIRALTIKANAHIYQKKYKEGIQLLDSIITTFKLKNLNEQLGFIYNTYGKIYISAEEFDKAVNYFNKELEIAEKIDNEELKMYALSGLGNAFNFINKANEAKPYYIKAMNLAKKNNFEYPYLRLLHALSHILLDEAAIISESIRSHSFEGNTFTPPDYETPFSYALISYQLAQKLNVVEQYEYSKCLASFYNDRGESKKAEELLIKGIEWEKKRNNKVKLAYDYNQMGRFKCNQKKYDEGIKYYYEALDIMENGEDHDFLVLLYQNLSSAFNQKNDYAKAYEYLLLSTQEKRLIKDDENYAAILNINAKYKDEKKQQEIILLSKEKELQLMEIKNKDREVALQKLDATKKQDDIIKLKQQEQLSNVKLTLLELEKSKDKKELILKQTKYNLKESELKKQKALSYAFTVGFILVLALVLFIYRGFKQKQKANVELAIKNELIQEQKELVEYKNKEITNSIEYALRIQTAILPPKKIVSQYLENSFILYKPKDIVAGDFYWMETIDNLVLFAACDCTGHGVPGAMVSVVCHNALNRAVREYGLKEPASILNKTAEIVLENFSKSEEEIQDGMDISICALNTQTKVIEWSGANNPLWIACNGSLTEIKPDKQCIGLNDNIKPFTNHKFNLLPDSTIYLFTDGYADQFGGQPERKLTKNRFKELLLSIQNIKIKQQAIELDNFISNYKKDIEQTDDILVIGVKV
jgi:serine phosphatase RsbU (regulator of sigma subunit)